MDLSKQLTYIILTWILSTNIYAQNFELKNELHNYLDAIHSQKGFSGEILVAKEENILFQEAIGLVSIENNIPLKNGAKYRIASITKTFTGTLFAIAKEEGKLDDDDKAIEYINNLSPKFKNITLLQLLKHTSGLPNNKGIQDYWLIKSKIHLETNQIIEEINELELLFKPGTKMKYSSLGYYLLATVLEKIYKDSYQNIITDKIFNKVGMSETGIVNTIDIIPEMAKGYHLVTDDNLVVAPYRNYSMLKGAGDLYTTALDLLKWNNSFFNNKLINEKSKESIFKTSNIETNKAYGLGWFIEIGKLKKYFHGGGTWGYSSYLAQYPKTKISIIVLSNISTLPVKSIGQDIEKIVFKLPFEMPKKEYEIVSSSININKYTGIYKSKTSEMKLNISVIDGNLFTQLGKNPPFQIYRKGDNEYFGKKINIHFIFMITNNAVTELTVNRMRQVFNFVKQ